MPTPMLEINSSDLYLYIGLGIIGLIIFAFLYWIYYTLSLNDKDCTNINKMYKNIDINGKLQSSHNDDNIKKSSLVNLHIKTAYNCCCGDGYKNNFVTTCALKRCIHAGARCLDFEVYSYYGHPIIAASTSNSNYIKETFNYLKFKDVIDVINDNAFTTLDYSVLDIDESVGFVGCPNSDDPLFIHLRIMSTNENLFSKLYDQIITNDNSNNFLKKSDYNTYIDEGNNYRDLSFNGIGTNKILLMVTTNYSGFQDTSLNNEYTFFSNANMEKNLKLYRYSELEAYGESSQSVITETKVCMSMVLPDYYLNNTDNYDIMLPYSCGINFIGMKYQNYDTNLKVYFKDLFNEHAFINKSSTNQQDPPYNVEFENGTELAEIDSTGVQDHIQGGDSSETS